VKLNHDFSKVINTPLFKELQKTVNETKMEAYVIGGFVRDHLLNRPNKKDIDIESMLLDALPIMSASEASKEVSKFTNLSRKEVYNIALKLKGKIKNDT
jgi:tRNA nucleotidyltransferase/poly(A) polymerase